MQRACERGMKNPTKNEYIVIQKSNEVRREPEGHKFRYQKYVLMHSQSKRSQQQLFPWSEAKCY